MPDRKQERTEIARIVQRGRSIQMLAPRRVGKTWLMHRVAEDLRTAGWTAVVADAEGMSTEDEFLREICQKIEGLGSLSQKMFSQLSQRLKQISSGGWEGNPVHAIGRIDPKGFSEALVASLDTQGGETLILVDEISVFVTALLRRNETTTLDFLYHLRKLRQFYPHVRWLLTGSIGLDVVARRSRLQGALVDLDIFPLEPFTETAAQNYLTTISERGEVRQPFVLDEIGFAHFVRELGWLSPYYLRVIADRVFATGPLARNGVRVATVADIERAFDELLKPPFRGYFVTWEEHIDKNFPPDEATRLHAILGFCCEQIEGETFGTLQTRLGIAQSALLPRDLKNLLTVLENDGFIHEIARRWRFRSGLLRRYWLRYLHE